jgi:hypothetical protein
MNSPRAVFLLASPALRSLSSAPAALGQSRIRGEPPAESNVTSEFSYCSCLRVCPRDWDRFNSLFAPGARLTPIGPRKDKPGIGIFVMTPKDYSDRAGAYFDKNGFVEREASRKSERYGNIMQVFSTYESRHDAKDEKPFARGINSFQLYYDGTRWWVVTIMWQEETPENPLPKEFLTPAK